MSEVSTPLQWNDELVKNFWDYHANSSHDSYFTKRYGKGIAMLAKSYCSANHPIENVLDYGCGIGRIAKELILKTSCKVIGVDISESMRKMDELTQISKINSVLIDNGIETI